MKIKITTIREIDDRDYWHWIHGVNMGLLNSPIDGEELLEKGKFTFSSIDMCGERKTSASTTYQIVKG